MPTFIKNRISLEKFDTFLKTFIIFIANEILSIASKFSRKSLQQPYAISTIENFADKAVRNWIFCANDENLVGRWKWLKLTVMKKLSTFPNKIRFSGSNEKSINEVSSVKRKILWWNFLVFIADEKSTLTNDYSIVVSPRKWGSVVMTKKWNWHLSDVLDAELATDLLSFHYFCHISYKFSTA